MKRTHTNLDEIELLTDAFNLEAEIRGISFPEEYVKGQAFDDFVQQFLDGDDMPHINILEGMTCERSKDWLNQQVRN